MPANVELCLVLLLSNIIVISEGDPQWPQGEYILPKSTYGCPDQDIDSWDYGYMNITFKQTIQLYESSLGKIGWNDTDLDLLELLGPYGQHSIQLNFCSHANRGDTNVTEWPRGQYGIYGTKNRCPSGFTEMQINKTVPEVLYVNKDGYFPDINIFTGGDNTSVIGFPTCQRHLQYEDGDLTEEFKNFNSPFILLAPQDEQQNFSNDGFVTLRKLFFLSATDNNGTTTRYNWINYYAFDRTDKTVTVEEPTYLDHYMANATISYASEVLYSLGCCKHVIYPRHGTEFECEGSTVTDAVWNEDIWLLYSIGTSITVSGISIWAGYYLDFGTRPEEAEAIPYVYVSEQKWGFLQNGALQCLRKIHTKAPVYGLDTSYDGSPWVLIKCLNSPVGRYVAFVFPKRTNSFDSVMKFFVEDKNIKHFISLKVAPRCNRPLGMREGGLFDDFLTASSAHHDFPPHQARPYGRGWCAQTDDTKPFLQMDFSMPHQIEGIQIFNWPKGNMYRATSPLDGRTIGVSSFSVQYGFHESTLSSLNQVFHLDPFLPAEHAQTVWFAAPFDTRYLRILPLKQMDDSALNCLRLEVIGCPVSDRFLAILQGSLSSFTHLSWEDKRQHNPGVVGTYYHPFYYPTGTAHTWTISFAKGQYINLLVSDFSLNIYKGIDGFDSNTNAVCADAVYLYPFDYSPSFMGMWYLMEYLESGRLEDPDVLQPIVLTSSLNDQQLSYKINMDIVNIAFRTCPEIYPIETRGRGFRMLAYSSGTPTCVRWDYPSSYRKGCSWEEANLASTSFLGIFFKHSEFNFWTLSLNCDYIVLQVTDFDVGCDTGTVFEITNGWKISRYCNKNKPVFKINSIYDVLKIKFQTKLCDSHVLIEGFRGSYKAEFRDKSVSNLTSIVERDTDRLKYYSHRVCSEDLNKCYIIVDLKAIKYIDPNLTDVSWDMFNEMVCRQHGWTMISIHSRTEQEFIRLWTKYEIKIELAVSHPDGYNGYAYLGLRRMLDKFVWSHGNPITYEAWGPGEPSKSRKLDCTRLNMRSRSTEITWESISCDAMKAEVGVCEYRMHNVTEKTDTCGFQMGPSEHLSFRPENDLAKLELEEELTRLELSLYFQCGDGEFISLLGRCDGKQDCVTGGDEAHCDNSSICTVTQYRCNDGRCIDVSTLCDYTKDCINGEDVECYFPECGPAEYSCDSKMCIDIDMRCDGKPDCSFGEDENRCGSCNPGTSFSCGDGTCIPLAYRCDGRPDCQSEEDEKNCIKPNTCQEWWNAGYRDNGMYTIHNEEMECNFDNIFTSGQIITKYHSIDFLGDEGKRSDRILDLQYGSLSALHVLTSQYRCFQSVDQLCQAWIQELYEVDNELKEDQRQLCHCIRYVKWLTEDAKSYYEDCNGTAINGYHSVLSFESIYTFPYIERIEHDLYDEDRLTKIRIKINPVVCFSDFIPELPDIVCGNGMTAPNETRCLFNVTEFGAMSGCRNLAHLQECECFPCPVGYFKCPKSFCLESRFVCDGYPNCLNGEDEEDCGLPTQICVSQYRCLQSNICLPQQYLCDGYRQCPLGDDERLCNFRCPEGCNCTGMTADCRMAKLNNASDISFTDNTKYLDISTNSDFFPFLTRYNKNLIFLSVFNMSFCGITDISPNFFESMRNMLILDLSYNNIYVIKSNIFVNQNRLSRLHLTGNTEIHVIEQRAFDGLRSLTYFELSHVHIGRISKEAFRTLNVKIFDVSNNVIDSIENHGFDGLRAENVYLNATEVNSFDDEMFSGIEISHQLITGAYMFCCIRPQKLPEENCYPHEDEFSSCSDLMRNDALRTLLWIIGLFSLLGNSASLIYRFLYDRERLKLGYGIFVSNLAFTDFLMGVYLITIASADATFRGTYTYNEEYWRNSGWCKLAGVLSTISSEGSVLFICLITIDRLLVIKYPFGKIRFTTQSAVVVSFMVWFTVVLIAVLPIFVTSYFNGSFYSKTGVCLALPLTRDRPPGWVYSISIFIGFNFVAFLAIAFGQWLIYSTVNKARSAMKRVSTSRIRDLRVARNLLLVATTDFLCWFPVGILGILALTGHVIPGDVYAWVAVLVLPINSALNPFLYTLSTILTRGKFSPDTSEQTRNPDMQGSSICFSDTKVEKIRLKRALDRLLDLWNSRLLIPPMLSDSFVPLPEYISSGQFNLQKCLRTTVTITKCLILLHERDLSHSNLSVENVFVKPADKGSFNVALSPHPRLVSTEGEKQADIEQFGYILDDLLKKSCR